MCCLTAAALSNSHIWLSIQHLGNGSIFLPLRHNKCMKLLNNHYFSTLSCYNTRLLDSLQAKFLRLPSRSRPFILPCSCKFSVCPKNRVSVFRFMKKTCIFLFFFLSQKRCKECALAHSGVSRGRLRHVSASRECASSRSIFCFIGRNFL